MLHAIVFVWLLCEALGGGYVGRRNAHSFTSNPKWAERVHRVKDIVYCYPLSTRAYQ